MYIIKRNGEQNEFNIEKITNAVEAANLSVSEEKQFTYHQIMSIAEKVQKKAHGLKRAVSVEEISDMVEDEIMAEDGYEVARNYIKYRFKRALSRKQNTTDESILSLLECNNELVKQENSNKNPVVNSVQRDYMAGEVSKDLCKRVLVPEDVWNAHEEGIIHFHDADYFAQHMHNCCLVNLEDMLQNGTVISGTYISKPKSFATACNIATQAIAQIASVQYGGQTISIAHLVPFIDVSRKKIEKQVIAEYKANDMPYC